MRSPRNAPSSGGRNVVVADRDVDAAASPVDLAHHGIVETLSAAVPRGNGQRVLDAFPVLGSHSPQGKIHAGVGGEIKVGQEDERQDDVPDPARADPLQRDHGQDAP